MLEEWVVVVVVVKVGVACWQAGMSATYHLEIRSSGDPAAEHVRLHLDRRCRKHAQASTYVWKEECVGASEIA